MPQYSINFHNVKMKSELKKRFAAIPKNSTELKFRYNSLMSRNYLEEIAKLIPARIISLDLHEEHLNQEEKLTFFCQALPDTIKSLSLGKNGLTPEFLQMLHGKKLTSLRLDIPPGKELTPLFENLPSVKLLGLSGSLPTEELINALPALPETINCLDLESRSGVSVEQLIAVLGALPPHITRIKLSSTWHIKGVEQWCRVLAAFPLHLREVTLPQSNLTSITRGSREINLILDDDPEIAAAVFDAISDLEQAVATRVLDHHAVTFRFDCYAPHEYAPRVKRLNQQVGLCLKKIANTLDKSIPGQGVIDTVLAYEVLDLTKKDRQLFFDSSLSKEDEELLSQSQYHYFLGMVYWSLSISGLVLLLVGLVGFTCLSTSLAVTGVAVGALGLYGLFSERPTSTGHTMCYIGRGTMGYTDDSDRHVLERRAAGEADLGIGEDDLQTALSL